MRFLLMFLLALAGSAAASDPLDIRVRPQLPATIHTVGEAAAWYAETVGYRFYARSPGSGDGRKIAYAAVRRARAEDPPMPLRDALLSLVAPDVELVVDRQSKAIAFRSTGVSQ